jgi:hypothetical protein
MPLNPRKSTISAPKIGRFGDLPGLLAVLTEMCGMKVNTSALP